MENLIAYMLLSALAVNMVPGKAYRRYISLAGGLIMIVIIIKSAVSIMGGESSGIIKEAESYMNEGDDVAFSLEDIASAYDAAEEFLDGKPDYETVGYEETVRAELADIGAVLEGLDITRDRDGYVLRIIVYLTADEMDDEMTVKAGECVSGVYDLDADSVYVVFK